tara:strand:+ start:153 stop:347 length:195 start_codon:yes stop_codon:yes gene_type:complete
MIENDDDNVQAGTAEIKTVKAGCGIRFDPEVLNEDAGFDFSQAQELKDKSEPDLSQNEQKKEIR